MWQPLTLPEVGWLQPPKDLWPFQIQWDWPYPFKSWKSLQIFSNKNSCRWPTCNFNSIICCFLSISAWAFTRLATKTSISFSKPRDYFKFFMLPERIWKYFKLTWYLKLHLFLNNTLVFHKARMFNYFLEIGKRVFIGKSLCPLKEHQVYFSQKNLSNLKQNNYLYCCSHTVLSIWNSIFKPFDLLSCLVNCLQGILRTFIKTQLILAQKKNFIF